MVIEGIDKRFLLKFKLLLKYAIIKMEIITSHENILFKMPCELVSFKVIFKECFDKIYLLNKVKSSNSLKLDSSYCF